MGTNPGDVLRARSTRSADHTETITLALDTLDRISALLLELSPDSVHEQAGRMMLYRAPADAPVACWRLYQARFHAVGHQIATLHSEYVRLAREVLRLQECEEDTQPFSRPPDRGADGGERP